MRKRLVGLMQIQIMLTAILSSSALADANVWIPQQIDLESKHMPGTVLADSIVSSESVVQTSTSTQSPSSYTTSVESPVVRLDYQHRLDLMKEQMDNAKDKGWIKDQDSALLQSDYSQLLSSLMLVRAHGFPDEETQGLEKQFNSFNIELSHKISSAGETH